MKKIFVLSAVVVMAACNSNESAKTGAMADSAKAVIEVTTPAIKSPYAIGYSSSFAIDDPKNAETLLALWKDYDNGDLSAAKDMFADTVDFYFSNGAIMHGTRDSIIAVAQKHRDMSAKVVSSVNAITALKSLDKNEHWALIWGKEVDTDKKGKTDSIYLQETWRFNKDGKADMVYQFSQATTPPKK